jgi:hypothetical protein
MNYTTLLPRHIYPPTNYLEKQQDAKLANDYHYNMPFTGLVMQKKIKSVQHAIGSTHHKKDRTMDCTENIQITILQIQHIFLGVGH